MKSRPTKQKLKQRGILRERVFGCDLGEHLLNSGHDGEWQSITKLQRLKPLMISVVNRIIVAKKKAFLLFKYWNFNGNYSPNVCAQSGYMLSGYVAYSDSLRKTFHFLD